MLWREMRCHVSRGTASKSVEETKDKEYCQGNIPADLVWEISVPKRDVDSHSPKLYVAFASVYRSKESNLVRRLGENLGKLAFTGLLSHT